VRAATDVTGFGLLGHLSEVVKASEVSATIDHAAVPVLEGVAALVSQGMIPGGTRRNLKAVSPMVDFADTDETVRTILADAQTSGGLLLAVDAPLKDALIAALSDAGAHGWPIGSIDERAFEDGPTGTIRVR
jgi:selenide,water dikinase